MTLEENIRLLNLGFILNLNQPALERLEIYIVKQFAAEKESLMQNDVLLSGYMATYLSRKKCSQIMIQQGLTFIDIFFDKLR